MYFQSLYNNYVCFILVMLYVECRTRPQNTSISIHIILHFATISFFVVFVSCFLRFTQWDRNSVHQWIKSAPLATIWVTISSKTSCCSYTHNDRTYPVFTALQIAQWKIFLTQQIVFNSHALLVAVSFDIVIGEKVDTWRMTNSCHRAFYAPDDEIM